MPVVRKVNSAVHRTNLYPLDGAIGFPDTYPMDSAIQLLNKWGQDLRETDFNFFITEYLLLQNDSPDRSSNHVKLRVQFFRIWENFSWTLMDDRLLFPALHFDQF